MKFSFDYQQYHNRFLPIITLRVKNVHKQVMTDAYVDSGASISIFNTELAELLGIDYLKGKVIYPIGTAGHIKAHVVETILEINGIDVKCNALFSKEFASKFNLLGVHGIFDKFKITFDNKNRKIIFEEH